MLYELTLPSTSTQSIQHPVQLQQSTSVSTNRISSIQQKDYSRPLHVDCSVEYELPSQVKPPPSTNGKMDPLLMIHPCYFRKIEAQRRSPFINNLPGRNNNTLPSTSTSSDSCRNNRILTQQNCNQIRNQTTNVPNYNNTSIPPQYNRQQQWTTEQLQFSTKPNNIVKHSDHLLNHSVTSLGMYNNDGGLWNTNHHHSPLAAERFPDVSAAAVTLVHHPSTVMQSSAIDNSNTSLATSCNQQQKHMTGKYRQYLRTHRLHPYMNMATSAFPQIGNHMQQISCYNV